MIRKSLLIAIAIFSTNFALALDCGTTTLTHEKLYCSSPNLQVLGTRLTEAFSKALSQTNNAQQLRQEHTDWLNKELRTCTTEQCMEQAYKKRTAELSTIKTADTSDRRSMAAQSNPATLGVRDGGRPPQYSARDNGSVSAPAPTAPTAAPAAQSNNAPTTESVQAPKEVVEQPIKNKQEEVGNVEPSSTAKLGAFWDELWVYLQIAYGLVAGYLIFNFFNKRAKAVVPEGNGNRTIRNGNLQNLCLAAGVFILAYLATYGVWFFFICMPISVALALIYSIDETGIAFCKTRNTLEIPVGFKRIEIPVSDVKGTSGDMTTQHKVSKDHVTGKYKGETTIRFNLTIKCVDDNYYNVEFHSRQQYEMARDMIAEVAGLS
jgi:uncharacterized protein